MTPHEHHMLTYVRVWMRYGGADDDIYVTFGLSPLGFYTRVDAILAANPIGAGLDDAQRRAMRSFCHVKYQQYRERHRDARLDTVDSPRRRNYREAESARPTPRTRP